MARPRNANGSVSVTFTTTEQMCRKLDALTRAGLYGSSRAEVAERLMCEGLRTLIKEGFIAKCPVKLDEL